MAVTAYLIRTFNQLSIFKKLVLTFCLLSVFPLIFVLWYTIVNFNEQIYRSTSELARSNHLIMLNNYVDRVKEINDEIEKVIYDYTDNKNFVRYFMLESPNFESTELMRTRLFHPFSQNGLLEAIAIIPDHEGIFQKDKIRYLSGTRGDHFLDGLSLDEYLQLAKNYKGKSVLLSLPKPNNDFDILLVKQFRDLTDGHIVGYIGLVLNKKQLLHSIKPSLSEFADYKIEITDQSGSRDNFADQGLDSKQYLTFSAVIPDSSFTLISSFPKNEMYAERNHIQNSVLIVIGILIVVILIFSIFMALKLSGPIRRLKAEIVHFFHDKEKANSYIQESNEITLINYYFQHISRVNQELENKVLKLEIEHKKSELSNLRSIINPHFLYNTMDMIRWTAIQKGALRISVIIDYLSRYLRLGTMNSSEMVTSIDKEVEHTKYYIFIIKKRNPGRLKLTWDIDPEAGSWMTIKFLLQPIVENSVKYVLDRRQEACRILIEIKPVSAFTVQVKVQDNGPPLAPDEVERINRLIQYGSTDPRSSHIGLHNIYKRLSLYYEEECSLRFDNTAEGSAVVITFPLLRYVQGKGEANVEDYAG